MHRLAMFLAIKSFCEQRTGMPDLTKETMKKARDALQYLMIIQTFMRPVHMSSWLYESRCGYLKTEEEQQFLY